MKRTAFIASLALHSGLLALLGGATLHERTDAAIDASVHGWSANPDPAAELIAPDSCTPGEFSAHIQEVPRQERTGGASVKIPTPQFQPLASLTSPVALTAPLAPSLATLPSFASEATATRTARKPSGKSGSARAGQADAPPRYASCPPPAYPAQARKEHLSGTVVLRAEIDDRGRPLTVALHQTSGHAILDAAALRTVRAWRFDPARRDGSPVSARLEIPIRFALF